MKRTSTPANPAPNPSDEIFNVSTLAHYLHCHPSTVYRLLKDKKIRLHVGMRRAHAVARVIEDQSLKQ